MKRILITGGGTAGHVTPNLALIPALQAQGFEIHYVGRREGIERDLIAKTELPYHAISAGKLRRYFDLQNLSDLGRIGLGFWQALWLMLKLRPQAVFSKGGFVAPPLVWAAWLCRVPTIIHESDITPGLANRLSIPFATYICYSFPETKAHLPSTKAVQTGIPIRARLSSGNAAEGRRLCSFPDTKPTILVMGGSQGAATINETVRAALDDLLPRFNLCHLCGSGNIDTTLEGKAGYKQFTYADQELPHLLALVDIVVSRAGATTLFELLALRKPMLLIPLPRHSSRGDQILNAESFAVQGFSHVLLEEDLTQETLVVATNKTYATQNNLLTAMQAAYLGNAVEDVLTLILRCSR